MFQLQSILDYIASQDDVLRTLESELAKSRSDWLDTEKVLGLGEIWRHAQVQTVLFDRRLVHTVDDPKLLNSSELLGLTTEDLEEISALSDKPDTHATFTVVIQVDWDSEHGPRTAVFRDGRLSHFGIEGN